MGSAGMKRKGRTRFYKAGGKHASTAGEVQPIGGRGRAWFGGGACGAAPWGIGGRPSQYQWRPLAGIGLALLIGLALIALYIVVVY